MMKPITVLAITAEKNPSPCIKDQLSALEQMGIRIEQLEIDRVQKFYYLRAAWKVFSLSFQKRYDLIHGFYGYCGLVARMQFRYPVIVTFQGSDLLGGKNTTLHKRDGMIGSLVTRVVDAVIVMSKEMKDFSSRRDTYVIPFGVNTQVFKSSAQAEIRRELGLDPDAKLILFPWNPNRVEKNYAIAEDAVRLLQQEDSRIQLLPLYNKPREIVAQYMNACDAMVLVSDHEGSPMAVREAMACNLPIVSVGVGDVPHLIQDVQGCYLCKPEPTDVAEKLRTVLHARQRTKSEQKIANMDVDWAAKQVLEVYQATINRRKARLTSQETVRELEGV
jgi:glycosyltransferase involved in cell wall biosynthesis